MYFSKNDFAGHDSHNGKNFQIIPDNEAVSPKIKGCKKYGPEKKQYLCQNDSIALLLFESRDNKEVIYPATIKSSNPNISQELNAFAAHNWDGFYES